MKIQLVSQLNQDYFRGQKLAFPIEGTPLLLTIDGSELKQLDSAGLAYLIYLKREALTRNIKIEWQNMPEIFYTLCDLYEIKL